MDSVQFDDLRMSYHLFIDDVVLFIYSILHPNVTIRALWACDVFINIQSSINL